MEKARFCIATGVQPSEYEQLTRYERSAFARVVNQMRRR